MILFKNGSHNFPYSSPTSRQSPTEAIRYCGVWELLQLIKLTLISIQYFWSKFIRIHLSCVIHKKGSRYCLFQQKITSRLSHTEATGMIYYEASVVIQHDQVSQISLQRLPSKLKSMNFRWYYSKIGLIIFPILAQRHVRVQRNLHYIVGCENYSSSSNWH